MHVIVESGMHKGRFGTLSYDADGTEWVMIYTGNGWIDIQAEWRAC